MIKISKRLQTQKKSHLEFVFHFSFLSESPRWLLSKGRVSDAQEVIHKGAMINKTLPNLPNDLQKQLAQIYEMVRFSVAKIIIIIRALENLYQISSTFVPPLFPSTLFQEFKELLGNIYETIFLINNIY